MTARHTTARDAFPDRPRQPVLPVDVIAHNAELFAQETAVVCDGERLTWRELSDRVDRIAAALWRMGHTKGDHVAVLMANSLAMFESFWGIVRAGCVVVPLNPMLDPASLARTLNACDATTIITHEPTSPQIDEIRDQLDAIAPDRFLRYGPGHADGWRSADELFAEPGERPEVAIDPDDSMTIMYSSGSTGVPKGIEHSHGARMIYPLGFGMGLRVDRHSKALCTTPLHASGSWITIFPTMYRGGTVVLMSKFTAEGFLAAIEAERCTHTFVVPAMAIAALGAAESSQHDVSSLRVLITSGQPLNVATKRDLQRLFPASELYEVYGLTEGLVFLRIPEDAAKGKGDSVGKTLFFDETKIIGDDDREVETGEVGELVGIGPGVMKGYYNRPELTEQAVWLAPDGRRFLRTGDLGRVDEDGYLYITGRKKDMIKSGGINIYAVDLENELMEHPGVAEVAVVGVPHPKWGETPIAICRPAEEDGLDPDEVMAWVNDRVAKYQRLSRVFVVSDFPRATYGKVHKQRLREQYRTCLESGNP